MSMTYEARQSALYGPKPRKGLSAPLMAGVVFAGALHAGLFAYLINAKFFVPPIPIPDNSGIKVEMPPKIIPEVIDPPKPLEKAIVLHQPDKVIITDTVIETDASSSSTSVDNGPTVVTQFASNSTTGSNSSASTIAEGTIVGPRAVDGIWDYPTQSEMEAYYPERAISNDVEGMVVMDCVINSAGRITGCTVVAETPRGYGFGKATVEAFMRFATVKPSADGTLRDGDHKRFTYKWQLD